MTEPLEHQLLAQRVPWSRTSRYIVSSIARWAVTIIVFTLIAYIGFASFVFRFTYVDGAGVRMVVNPEFRLEPGALVVYNDQADPLAQHPLAPILRAVDVFPPANIGRVVAGPYGPLAYAGGALTQADGRTVTTPVTVPPHRYPDTPEFLNNDLVVTCLSGPCTNPAIMIPADSVYGVIDEQRQQRIKEQLIPWNN